VGEEPYVIEYNVRMGDPETEVVLPAIQDDFLQLLCDAADGNLSNKTLKVSDETVATVMLVSGGYPEKYEKGKEISGLDTVSGAWVFHAGTKLNGDKVITSGGRVLAVTAEAGTLEKALEKCYSEVNKIKFEGQNYRRDIGADLK
jgi:phosphoribosylamine--glycine ligase